MPRCAVPAATRAQFDWAYRELEYAVCTVARHPDVSSHPQAPS
jgi:hypothetical protein